VLALGTKTISEQIYNSYTLKSEAEVAQNGETGKQAIMHFQDLDPGYGVTVSSDRDTTYDTVQKEDSKLGDFLARPVKIYEERWSTGAVGPTINDTVNPWELFCENAAVFEKLKYFNNLSGDLHLKFVINGNSFLYGRLMVSYEPVPYLNEIPKRNAFEIDYIEYSQRPKIFLNPTSNEGGTMILPFFWPKNYLNIPGRDWRDMGVFTLSEIAKLRHANGETQGISVTCYAHMENVVLATPTALQSQSLISQGKRNKNTKTTIKKSTNDEYGSGAISKPASAIAAAAGWLTDLPVIGPYARATEMVASKVGEVAKVFGYSRPVDLENTKRVRTVTSSAFAVTDQPDTVMKLTLDSKNETTIDARTVGLNAEDHMGIYDIAQKESFLTSFLWTTFDQGDIPTTRLYSSNITPSICDIEGLGSTLYMTPMAFMSQLFTYWHGSIIMRFQIVASNFHKGRLLVQYDPNGYQNLSTNIQYTEVIDLAETRDFEVCLGWGKSEPFLSIGRCGAPNGGTNLEFRSDGSSPANNTWSNGQITVSVLNELTVPGDPTSSPPIQVNVFVKAGEDMQFAVPSSAYIHDLSLTPLLQSQGLISQSEVTTDATTDKVSMENKPEETMKLQMNEEGAGTDHLMEVFFGEHITSLRSLFKRYCFHTTWRMPFRAPNTASCITVSNKVYPFMRAAFDAPGVGVYDYASGPAVYSVNPSVTFPLTYCAPAFVGWRGSIRRKIINNVEVGGNMRCMIAHREPYSLDVPSVSVMEFTSPIDYTVGFNSPFVDSANGLELSILRNNACLEVESPFYQPLRFLSTRKILPASLQGETIETNTYTQLTGASESVDRFQSDFIATGEDFTLFFFLSVPRMYRWGMPLEL